MNSVLRQTTGSIAELWQSHFKKQPLSWRLYLFERSLDRYAYLKTHGAPNILIDAEEYLIRRRLLSLGADKAVLRQE